MTAHEMAWLKQTRKISTYRVLLHSLMSADVSAADAGPGQFRDCVSGFAGARR